VERGDFERVVQLGRMRKPGAAKVGKKIEKKTGKKQGSGQRKRIARK